MLNIMLYSKKNCAKMFFIREKKLRGTKVKKTTDEIVRSLKIKKPGALITGIFNILARVLYYRKCKVEVKRSVNLKDYKNKPILVVSNHASRMDYAFINFALKGRKTNFVAAENEFHRSHLKTVFRLAHVIPKKNFYPDMTTIKGMSRILRKEKNGCVCIFPCGMSTATGAQQPSAIGSGKMLKHFGVTVLAARIHGGYLLSPKFDVKERYGKVEVELFELFTPEQLAQLDEAEIQRRMDDAIFTDDFVWNEKRQHSYKCNWGCANHLEQLMYKCPKCGAEMRMVGSGNEIKCLECGNGGTLDNKYNLVPFENSVLPQNLRVWFDEERRAVRHEVSSPDFSMEEHVQIGTMQKYGYIKNKKIGSIFGDGILRVDKIGVSFKGTRDGKPYEFLIPLHTINTICFPVDTSFFYTYANNGEFLYFVPDSVSSTKWMLTIEEMYRISGGKWQNYPWFNYEEENYLEGYPLKKD